MPFSSPSTQRAELRRQLREVRRRLTPAQRSAASLAATTHLLAHPWYRQARRIALYWPVGSEVDTTALMAAALRDRKRVFLPAIVCRGGGLLFVRLRPGIPLGRRRHGIPQPRPVRTADVLACRRLDLVVVPLLGFDDRGHRLGSGAGYYDRSFAFRPVLPGVRPRLVGLAFAAQQVPQVAAADWDVPLDAVVTENGWQFRPA
ncbi:MAG TPA: 5-formyltetrahydrofolate cyclo-ligase [Nevskiales bacterium]|nr:5-formyltetrahydrofolate cyclo-ligase [Nevskiales bacterium]